MIAMSSWSSKSLKILPLETVVVCGQAIRSEVINLWRITGEMSRTFCIANWNILLVKSDYFPSLQLENKTQASCILQVCVCQLISFTNSAPIMYYWLKSNLFCPICTLSGPSASQSRIKATISSFVEVPQTSWNQRKVRYTRGSQQLDASWYIPKVLDRSEK